MLPARIRIASLTAVMLFAWIALSQGNSITDGQKAAKALEKRGQIKELQKERLAAIRGMFKQNEAGVKNGQIPLNEILASIRMLAEAELEVCESDKERLAALEKILVAARDTERLALLFAKSGEGRESTALKAKAERLRFEIAVERLKSKVAAKPIEGNASQDLRDQAALAENQAAIRLAAVKVVQAQKARAQANLATIKAQVEQARAAGSFAEMQYQRMQRLFDTKSIEEGVLNESRSKVDAAKARQITADSQVAEAESQVAIEQARILQAELEHAEAELRLKQLRARLQSQ